MTSFVLPSRTSTVQRACSLDQRAPTARLPYRIFRSIPYSAAVSWMYARIDGPSAMAFGFFHGRNGKPSVCMSESDRMPG